MQRYRYRYFIREMKKIHLLLVLIVENYPRNYETVVVEVDLPLFPPDASASDRWSKKTERYTYSFWVWKVFSGTTKNSSNDAFHNHNSLNSSVSLPRWKVKKSVALWWVAGAKIQLATCFVIFSTSVADPHHVAADPDAYPYPNFHFDTDPDLDPANHFAPDPDPGFHIMAQNLEKVLK